MRIKELDQVMYEYENVIKEISDLTNTINNINHQLFVLNHYRDLAEKKREVLDATLKGLAE